MCKNFINPSHIPVFLPIETYFIGDYMGRIKTKLVKRITLNLVKAHADKLNKDFDKNKEVVESYTNCKSRKLRNIIAGYATRLVKNTKEI